MNLREDRTIGAGRSSEITCKSQRLMLQAGLIQPANTGCFHYLPYTVRAMEKLVRVIDKEMQSIGGQKVNMPSLTSASLWKTSERWDLLGKELFRLKDRHNMEYCLSPTHEEAVTELIAMQGNLSYRQLPLMLYQVTRKFRDEPKPRFGLLRGREFYMKDMYTFDVSEEAAMETYDLVSQAYSRIFDQLGLQFVKVQADTGSIGGKMSHEFQLPADIGEDRLLICSDCHFAANVEAMTDIETNCPQCHGKLKESKGIEGKPVVKNVRDNKVRESDLALTGEPKKKKTEVVRVRLSMASSGDDDGMDALYDHFKEKKYKGGFNEDNWEEEFEKIPMFMKKPPEELDPLKHPELACIQSMLYDEDQSPEGNNRSALNDVIAARKLKPNHLKAIIR
eukprot:g46416.t1